MSGKFMRSVKLYGLRFAVEEVLFWRASRRAAKRGIILDPWFAFEHPKQRSKIKTIRKKSDIL